MGYSGKHVPSGRVSTGPCVGPPKIHLLIHLLVHASDAMETYLLAMDGYKLDSISDCDVITLRRADDSVVCRFGMYATEETIEEAIAEDESVG